MIFEDSSIDDITTEDLCGDYPAVRFDADVLAERFGFRCAARLEGERSALSDAEGRHASDHDPYRRQVELAPLPR